MTPLVRALTAEPSAEELAGEQQALAAFRATTSDRPALLARPRFWRPAVLSTVLATKLGAAVAAGAVGLSGAAAAAYTGNLPDTLQNAAHHAIKAPPAHAKGPDASGSAAWGLCQAFAKDKQQDEKATPEAKPTDKPGKGLGRGNGKAQGNAGEERGKSKERSVAYRNLVRAAGGEDKVEAYCAAVPRPSGEPDAAESGEQPKPTKTPHATGKPAPQAPAATHAATTTATAEPTDEPTDQPTDQPSGTPSS